MTKLLAHPEVLWAITLLHKRLNQLEPPQPALGDADLLGKWLDDQWEAAEQDNIEQLLKERGAV